MGFERNSYCVPSGPEICFDAIDNNCNGIFEEGCGIRSGNIQFILSWESWENEPFDVKLNVTGPSGELATFEDASYDGLIMESPCPAVSCNGNSVQNVFLKGENWVHGIYKVQVRLDSESTPEVFVRFGVRMGQNLYHSAFKLYLNPDEQERQFEFEF